jgi:hypothetical protein
VRKIGEWRPPTSTVERGIPSYEVEIEELIAGA